MSCHVRSLRWNGQIDQRGQAIRRNGVSRLILYLKFAVIFLNRHCQMARANQSLFLMWTSDQLQLGLLRKPFHTLANYDVVRSHLNSHG